MMKALVFRLMSISCSGKTPDPTKTADFYRVYLEAAYFIAQTANLFMS